MAAPILGILVFRIILPICLLVSIIFRPTILSALYLLLLLYLPFVPVPSTRTMRGHTGHYLRLVICISFLTSITQLTFQIVLLAIPPYAYFLKDCEFLERILRHVGFIRLNQLSAKDIAQWLSPEIVMLFTSIAIYVFCGKLVSKYEANKNSRVEDGENTSSPTKNKPKENSYGFITTIGKYVCMASLCVGACLRPSVPGAFYFLIFLGSMTWWASYKNLRKSFAVVCRITLVVLFFHISALYAYQFQWPQELLDSNSTYARYFGLTPIMSVNCTDPRVISFNDIEWVSYLNPIWLLWLFYILTLESKLLMMPKLIRAVSPAHKYSTAGAPTSSILQDSTGSVTVVGDGRDEIPLQTLGTAPPEEEIQSTLFENILYAMGSIFRVLVRSSYIATNITMMAWSITYHSWLTFVLLLWANLLWLLPNQRRAMFRSAPFLVIYAEFLLLSAYVYSMNLTEEELPSKIQNVNLAQIGFEKVLHFPCKALLAKCLYTTMFWITLRQFMHERQEARQTSALADMVAPLQVSVGTATSAMNKEEQSQGSRMMKKIGEVLKKFLTKFWIWIVAINLFVVAITGERMTGFRIIYMFLFLIFMLTFQISFHAWRKMMYGFWITVIGYSMLTLVLVYTYQFDNFPRYWTEYLRIPHEQQLDIGLEIYETTQLFVRLLTPTFFVVITVIQVHYFHKDFLEISDIKGAIASIRRRSSATQNEPENRSDASSAQGGPWDPESEKTETETTMERPRISFKRNGKYKDRFIRLSTYISRKIQKFFTYCFLFLELHFFKIVFLLGMLLTVYDTCAIHFAIMILCVLAVNVGNKAQTVIVHLSSTIVSVMLLARMVYQIKYIDHSKWDVVCDNTTMTSNNQTEFNSAEWLGFRKINRGRELPALVKWYIAFILVATLRSIVLIKQKIWRRDHGKIGERPYFLFPKVTRADADKNIANCLMFLFNYGYYKFGVEVCLMATVALIGTRMDFYACLYGLWLCLICMMNRNTLGKVWGFYLAFISFVLPLQYFMVVGLPPALCIDLMEWLFSIIVAVFPWDVQEEDAKLRRMQDWMFLLDNKSPPQSHKLICDIFVLILVARQAVVFRIERRFENEDYKGGSNKSIIHLAEDPTFVNPVPDFVTYVRTWLDIFKRGILLTFMWITLAIVFLAGTNRVNLFSLGYLVGSFIFLWQGSDLYLRPIKKIIRSWNYLLAYNVFVIIIKTVLQIWGCIFLDDVHICWLMRLVGIGCIKKFGQSIAVAGLMDSPACPPVPRQDIGLAWDGICFGFLIMQRRIFQSFNFFHMIDETKATTILASRGAELMSELRLKQMGQKAQQEAKILEKIKHKMDRIKAHQQKIQGPNFKEPGSHFVEDAPIARSPSLSSCTSTSATSEHTAEAGYHTPIDDEDPPPLTPRTGSLLQTQAPSPCSALMTVSLEGYLEPQRMSFGSPPNSDLNPRPPSDDDSFPVFSPPPYDTAVGLRRPTHQRQTSIGPPWMQGSFITPRQSIISYSSRSPQSHHTYQIYSGARPKTFRKVPTTYKEAIRSGDYYMFDDLDEDQLDLISEKEVPVVEDDLADTGQTTIGKFLKEQLGPAKDDDTRIRRRSSMPLDRQQSHISTRSHLSAPLPTLSSSDKSTPRRSIRIVDDRIHEIPEPQPGSSQQPPEDEMSLLSDEAPQPESKGRKLLNGLSFVWGFVQSVMNTITNFLNKFSRDYRYVLRVLSKEKKLLKEKTNFRVGVRRQSTHMWEPLGSFRSLVKQSSEDSSDTTASVGSLTPTDSYRRFISADRSRPSPGETVENDPQPSSLEPIFPRKGSGKAGFPLDDSSSPTVDIIAEYETAEMSSLDQPAVIRLLHAIWFLILSHSDLVCYFMIILNQIKSASVLSLPLPLMVFLWGTLTIPRPSKTFWITIIAYTEIIVLIKCIFQFKIIEETAAAANNPFYPPRILGIERTNHYATYDLLLLLLVFFHRLMLKTLGLWKSSYEPKKGSEEGIYKIKDDDEDESTFKESQPKSPPYHMKQLTILSKEEVDELQQVRPESDEESSAAHAGGGDTVLVKVTTEEINPLANLGATIKLGAKKYMESLKEFFKELRDPTSTITADVYAYMFLCDFFNFLVVIFGFAAFGTSQGDGGVSAYLQENKVPIPFLLMLILQFILIIVDRALFLRKYILGKIIFQFLQIVGVHIWMFFVLPAITERGFNALIPPQMWYMVKCFYLLLSAYQIRCGYPTRILGNFLCKGFNYVNMFLFKAFMAVPFLFELRTIMDWMWTDTSMTLNDWLKMEDIWAHIFLLKCTRHVESEYPQPRGEKKKAIAKYFMGGAGLFAIIAVIWFPLVFFALGNTVGEPNIPYDVTVNLRIGPYQPIYSMSAQTNAIYQFSENEFNIMNNNYKKNRIALTFLSTYEHEDIAAVRLNGNSTMVWAISPPDIERMIEEVESDKDLVLRLQYIISRFSNNKQDSGIITSESESRVPAKINGRPNPFRTNLAAMLRGNQTVSPIMIQKIFPKFVKVTNRAIATPVSQLIDYEQDIEYLNLTTKLSRSQGNPNHAPQMWWELKEDCKDTYYRILKNIPYYNCEYLVMYTFNEKSFPASLSFLSGGGIIGLYTTLVFVASRMIRGFFSEICFKIMFDDMPNVDRILQLCLDIYLVREARELCLEEDLFAKAVFLFRSPETLIKWTRPKEDGETDNDDPDDEEEPPRPALQQ